jgi:hypothetical protein
MSLMPSTPIRLVPGLLRARGLKIDLKRLQSALDMGAIPGMYEKRRWVLTAEDVDVAERYFRETAAPGARKGGAARILFSAACWRLGCDWPSSDDHTPSETLCIKEALHGFEDEVVLGGPLPLA